MVTCRCVECETMFEVPVLDGAVCPKCKSKLLFYKDESEVDDL